VLPSAGKGDLTFTRQTFESNLAMAVFMREGTNSPELMFIVGPHTINPYLGRVPEGVTASCQAMRTWTLGNVQDPQFVVLSALQCIVWVATHQHLGFYDIALYDGHAKSPALTQGGTLAIIGLSLQRSGYACYPSTAMIVAV
jgi:hypothetical protein